MEVFLECLPCLLRQALEAAKMSTDTVDVQQKIMLESIQIISDYTAYQNAPDIARHFHEIVKTHTGVQDPYAAIKERDLQTALQLLPQLATRVSEKEDTLYWALKAAATGNVLDSAIGLTIDMSRFDEEFEAPFARCDLEILKQKLQGAKHLLLIGDNTGETVFDTLLLQQFPHLQLTYAVRNTPIINDATTREAIASGIDQYADIISTGCNAPGVLLKECSEEFLELFYGADIVICKGQGNYETLSESPRNIFYLLKAKCPVIARVLNVTLGDFVFQYRD